MELVTNERIGDDASVIRVDRSIKPVYPNWLKGRRLVCQNIQNAGPTVYDLAEMEHWLHPKQVIRGMARGEDILKELIRRNLLLFCLGLRDGEEILRNAVVFVRLFGTNDGRRRIWYLWKSAVQENNGFLYVPYLIIAGKDYLILDWSHMIGDRPWWQVALCYPGYSI